MKSSFRYDQTGLTLNVHIRERTDDLRIWNPGSSALEANGTWNDARVEACKIGCTEIVGTKWYQFTVPATLPAGDYLIDVTIQAGASATINDICVVGYPLRWDGAAEVLFAGPGDKMDIIDVPNATAITAIQDGLAQPGDQMDLVDAPNATAVTVIQAGLAQPGDQMDLITTLNAGAVTTIQTGLVLSGDINIARIVDLLECDFFVDITATPWQLVKTKKGDLENELLRKNLLTVTGSNVTSTSAVIGKHVDFPLGDPLE